MCKIVLHNKIILDRLYCHRKKYKILGNLCKLYNKYLNTQHHVFKVFVK